MRDIGYDFPTAVADLVDNSISAGATEVGIHLIFEPNASYVLIADNGTGMTQEVMIEALRFGSRRDYVENELGRFGLGLKTGSFSQCRRLSVVSRTTATYNKTRVLTLDLDFVEKVDQWSVLADEESVPILHAKELLEDTPGTVIVWEDLDRVLPDRFAESGWGRRRLHNLGKKTAAHLSMVFHRFLDRSYGLEPLHMSVNGVALEPWDPFAPDEPATQQLPTEIFEVETHDSSSEVRFTGHILPPRDHFSSPEQFERMSGPLKWNRQQGLYIYRANRLVQFGGWNGLRGIDEHTKLARASIDFDTTLDETFQVNVAKMSVVIPAALRGMLERPVHELCMRADSAYRKAASLRATPRGSTKNGSVDEVALHEVGVALKGALLETTELIDFRETLEVLRARHPDLSRSLGL